MTNRPAIRPLSMSKRPRMTGLRPLGSSITKTLPATVAPPRSIAGPSVASIRAPVMSTEPPMRAPIIRISPRALNWWMSRTAPPTTILSAWMARSPSASMVASRQIRRPPISDSQSQTAARFDVLALVHSAPTIRERDRSRSRRSRRPLPSRPGSRGQPVSDSSNSSAPSTSSGESNSQPSKRSGNGTCNPARSSEPSTTTLRSRNPRGSIWSLSSWQHLRSSVACTARLDIARRPGSTTAPLRPAPTSSASSISSMTRSPQGNARHRKCAHRRRASESRGARTPPTLPATGAGRAEQGAPTARPPPPPAGAGLVRQRHLSHPTAWAVRTRLVATEPSHNNRQCARSAVVN